MTKVLIILAATAIGLAAPPAFAQVAETTATDVAPVTVTAKRPSSRWEPAKNPIPPELAAGTETCWQAVQDPSFEALLAIFPDDPFLRPTVYQQTRLPRQPDWNAPPVTPPGSPFPDVLSVNDYVRGLRGDPDRKSARSGKFLECLGVTAPAFSNANPKAQINARDKTLPLGFALFDYGRYEEALAQFKVAERKLGSVAPGQMRGDLEAGLMIGKIYLYGLRERSDPVEGVKWLKRTAGAPFRPTMDRAIFDPLEPERNTPMGEAAMVLADVYSKGMGPVAKDPALARKYLERAYEVGYVPAAMTLGDIYYYGVDVPADPKKAFDYYMKAAKFAHAPATVAVAQMYAAGEVDGRPDPAKALAWYAQGARANHPQALYALAVAFDRGEGVAANPQTALAFYKLAATQGDPAAQTAIGTYFYTGEGGLPHDLTLARKWFELAATGGDADGMVNLAAMQAKGEGGEVDRVKAWGWLKIADRLGQPKAGAAVKAIEAQLTPQERAGVAEFTARKAG